MVKRKMSKKLKLGADMDDGRGLKPVEDGISSVYNLSSIKEKMKYLLESHSLSDVTLVVGPSEVEVPAHRLILSLNSPVFEAMFSLRWNTGGRGNGSRKSHVLDEDENNSKKVYLPDLDENAVKYFLKYIYTDEFNFPIEYCIQIIHVARYFGNHILEARCQEMLDTRVDGTNALKVYQETQHSMDFKESNTALNCLEYILFHAKNIFSTNSTGYLSLCHSSMLTLVSHDRLSIDESSLYDAVLRWGREQCHRLGVEETGPKIREILSEIINMIRFPLLPSFKITMDVSEQNILTDSELLSIYKAISCYELYRGGMSLVPDMKFPFTRRSNVCTLSRCKTPKHQKAVSEYCNSWHGFEFTINRSIRIIGVGMYTYNPAPVEYDVRIILHDNKKDIQITSVRRKLPTSELISSISQILFHTALLISPGTYELLFTVGVKNDSNQSTVSENFEEEPSFYSASGASYSKLVQLSMNEEDVQFEFHDRLEHIFTRPFPEIYFVFD